MTSPTLELAEQLARRLLAADPLSGSALGLREYDALLPDISVAADERLAADLADLDAQAVAIVPSADDRVTHHTIRAICARGQTQLEIGAVRYTVSALPLSGPPMLFAMAARTVLPDPEAAADYLNRLRLTPAWVDTVIERLEDGRRAGLLPVAALVEPAIGWAERVLATRLPAALVAPQPPADWDGAAGWRNELEAAVSDGVMPALARWHRLLVDVLPESRRADAVGLGALPDGQELYRRCIAVHTTLDLSADELHEIGLTRIAELEQRAVELGADIGLPGLAEVIAAVRQSAATADPEESMAAAREAVARAETRVHEIMPPPLPAPCAVEAMPVTVGEAGMAPHYTRPRADTGKPGTFWFNTVRATAGTGWDMEAVAFHETVPGHHSQLARLQLLGELPLVQQFGFTVHAEGWGLYAERLAEEFGLYSDVRAQLGSVYIEMHRAARLVVDTGMHHRGWSRERALAFMVDHVALPEQFLADEIDRYLAWPGQALAYLTGQREILRLRADAELALGERFDLPQFHAAVLDHGSVPMPVLAGVVADWVESRR